MAPATWLNIKDTRQEKLLIEQERMEVQKKKNQISGIGILAPPNKHFS
jgi:hypothetical protein